MKLTTKQLTLCAVLTGLALALSYLENFFPLSLAIPIPGIKLGLANIVTVFALYALGPAQALLILTGRCLLGAVFAGNMNALIFSLLGGFCLHAGDDRPVRFRRLSIYGVSIGGAGGPQLRSGGGSVPDPRLRRTAVLSARFAGRVPAHRRGDGGGGGVPVPGLAPHQHPAVTGSRPSRRDKRFMVCVLFMI